MVVAIPVTIPFTMTVPIVPVFEMAAISVPMAGIISSALVARSDPTSTRIRRSGPVTPMPSVVFSDRIPIPSTHANSGPGRAGRT
jgi:hypothetical protein